MREVVFSERALRELEEISLYLKHKFSIKTKNEFVDKVERLVLQLQKTPELFPKSELNNYHKGVIVKQVSVFYRFDDKKINIISVFDTRQNPKKIKN